MKSFFKLVSRHHEEELPGPKDDVEILERSNAPTAPTNLLLRFETANGPRTVIASSVSLKMAREVIEAMIKAGHYAEHIDRCQPASVADHIVMKKLEQLRKARTAGLPERIPTRRKEQNPAVHIAAE
jgi:hypothetical protein